MNLMIPSDPVSDIHSVVCAALFCFLHLREWSIAPQKWNLKNCTKDFLLLLLLLLADSPSRVSVVNRASSFKPEACVRLLLHVFLCCGFVQECAKITGAIL